MINNNNIDKSRLVPVTTKNFKIGDEVIRGKDWEYRGQDNNGSIGIIGNNEFSSINGDNWITVKWNSNNYSNIYRIGPHNFDLYRYVIKDSDIPALQE